LLGQEPARALPRQAPLSPVTARRRIRVLLLVFVLAAGCESAAEVTGVATQQDLLQLRTDLSQTQQTAQRAKADVDNLATQLGRGGREPGGEAEQRAKALAERLDGLATSLATLKSRVDELAASVDTLRRQGQAAAPARPVPVPVPSAPSSPSSPPPPARPTTGALQPQDVYQAAYIDISKGSYSLAIAGFREFLRRYPDHDLAGNAQYWIGEAYLSLARGYGSSDQEKATESLNQAVLEFRKVLANYPRGEKVPTAVYKEALALIELKQPQTAQQRLQYLVDNFPQAEEAPLARERLAALKK
jgi:tol-pal system protein YbgF